MTNEKAIAIFHTLIQVNNDRIKGYETAMKVSNEADLKSNFFRFIQSSRRSKSQLIREIQKSGGTPGGTPGETPGVENKLTGRFYGILVNLKAAINKGDRLSIFSCWEKVEDLSAEIYEMILLNDCCDLSEDLVGIIGSQRSLLEADRNKVKSFREKLLEAV